MQCLYQNSSANTNPILYRETVVSNINLEPIWLLMKP